MEKSTTLTNANETPKENSALIERSNIDGTPFWIWKDYRGTKPKYYLTMGDYKISEDCDEELEARQWPENHKWETMIAVMVSVIQKTEEVRKIAKEIPQG